MRETTRVTAAAPGAFSTRDVGKAVSLLGDNRPHTLVHVSMFGATLVPRRWWHRYRLARWVFLR